MPSHQSQRRTDTVHYPTSTPFAKVLSRCNTPSVKQSSSCWAYLHRTSCGFNTEIATALAPRGFNADWLTYPGDHGRSKPLSRARHASLTLEHCYSALPVSCHRILQLAATSYTSVPSSCPTQSNPPFPCKRATGQHPSPVPVPRRVKGSAFVEPATLVGRRRSSAMG